MVAKILRPTAKVLPEDGRAHNRSLVLQHLFHLGPTSRAELARVTGLTRVTISDLANDLRDESLVEELSAKPEGRVGKPAARLRLRSEAFQIVAMDLTDDEHIHGAVLDLTGTFVGRRAAQTHGVQGQDAVNALQSLASELVDAATAPLLGLGIGSPGVIDLAGTVMQAPNRGWYQLPLAAQMSEALSLPVHVANDADVAVLGELTYGGASPDGLMALRVGQGLGAGIIVDGARVRGHDNAAGEIGHLTVVDDRDQPGPGTSGLGPPLPCACGRTGCLETILSVPALRARTAGLEGPERAAVLELVGRRLGIALAPVISALNLAEIVLIGPPDLLEGPLREAALDTIRNRTMPVSSERLRARMTALGEDSALLGAVGLVLSGELGFS